MRVWCSWWSVLYRWDCPAFNVSICCFNDVIWSWYSSSCFINDSILLLKYNDFWLSLVWASATFCSYDCWMVSHRLRSCSHFWISSLSFCCGGECRWSISFWAIIALISLKSPNMLLFGWWGLEMEESIESRNALGLMCFVKFSNESSWREFRDSLASFRVHVVEVLGLDGT